ncbi:MAG: 1,4-dihydroxy-2-naphthoyl-CoA hydrolase [Saprospiraceae bacterium]|jgi:1,4-dihydroxy-2-naphthoyl-CoA hydrolase
MKIWKQDATLEGLNNMSINTLVEHIGIEWTEIGEDYLIAKMPVDKRTHQPMGLLHGGASVVLAESMGSTASVLCLEDMSTHSVVGLEINANHLKSVRSGWVYGTCKPIRVGRKIQVWNIEIRNETGDLCCVSRLTVAVVVL